MDTIPFSSRRETLHRFWRLLARYLRPLQPQVGLLALFVCGSIVLRVATPLLAGRFIDRALVGADSGELALLLWQLLQQP